MNFDSSFLRSKYFAIILSLVPISAPDSLLAQYVTRESPYSFTTSNPSAPSGDQSPLGGGQNQNVPEGGVNDIGLHLKAGPLRQGIGPTSLVVEVTPGSLADAAGILPDDIILMVDKGAADPGGQIRLIRQTLKRGRLAEVVVDRGGEWITFSISGSLPSQVLMAGRARGALDISIVKQNADTRTLQFIKRTRFASDLPKLEQLIDLAAAFGVEEHQISEALVRGIFVPHLEDLKAAYMELEGPSCLEVMKAVVRQRRERYGENESLKSINKEYLRNPEFFCKDSAIMNDKSRNTTWNDRFGGIPLFVRENYIFKIYGKPFSALEEDGFSPTVLQAFIRNIEYPQARCDFTARLGGDLDCGRLTPVVTVSRVSQQMEQARRFNSFGPSKSDLALRLQLFANGANEALNQLVIENTRSSPLVQLFGIDEGPESIYNALIARYARARVDRLGSCGDSLVEISKFHSRNFVTRRGGVITNQENRSYTERWHVPRKFASLVERLKNTVAEGLLGDPLEREFAEVFEAISCDSAARRKLEDNMVAYMNGSPLVAR